jgi:CubicO group peptidase (beta-lactamase class C family)
MKRLGCKIICVIAIAASCSGPGRERVSVQQLPGPRQQELDAFVREAHQAFPIAGLAIAVVSDHQIYWKTIGSGSLQHSTPLTDSTLLFTGNLSELMVATGIMDLASEGRIKLDDPVVKHLPYFKLNGKNYRNITIRHLLTHTSGVPYHAAVWDLPDYDDDALEATTRSVNDQQPEIDPPGSQVKRSPYNYDILADLISKASGTSFENYMQQSVFGPMQMKHSSFSIRNLSPNAFAKPHSISNWLKYNLSTDSIYPYNREHAGSIGWHSSVQDMAVWMNTLLHTKPELLKAQFKTGNSSYVGMGWEIGMMNELQVLRKTSRLGGFTAAAQLVPGKNIGVMVLSNTAGDFNPEVICEQVTAWLDGGKLHQPKMPLAAVLGRKLASSGSLDSCISTYFQLKKDQPAAYDLSLSSLSQLGVNLLYRAGKKEQAIRIFQLCADEHPAEASAHLNLAEAYMVNGEYDKSGESLKKAKALKKNDAALDVRLAYVEEALKLRTVNQ